MNYITKRLLISIPILIAMTFLAFTIMHLAPGDPGKMFMDPNVSVQDLVQIKENLGLDKPIVLQYGYWLKNLLQGNFGYSYISGKPVLGSISERLPATIILSVSSLILILIITMFLGLFSGAKQNSPFDHIVTILTFIGLSIPTFWLGLMLILFFSLKLNWLPTAGFLDPGLYSAPILLRILDILKHLALPLLTILIGGIASLTRYHRFGIIKILNEDYIKAARARGISETRILFKHAFKNAALPIITILGLSLPGLIGGSFVIEYIFSWPGMGQLGIEAIFARDYPILMGTILFSSILIIFGNLCADLAYSFIDPRIRKL
ncbi:ABC transporter permease [Candidatus Margulisiibacteriota bacterium]